MMAHRRGRDYRKTWAQFRNPAMEEAGYCEALTDE